MIALPRTPTGRIALAIALSLTAHAAVLFAPLVKLPPVEAPLPVLTAKLEPLPKLARPLPSRKIKPQPAAPLGTAQPDGLPAEGNQPEAPPAAPPAPATEAAAEQAQPAHPLPRRAQLTFIAYKGADLRVGEARHTLEIGADRRYLLKVGMNTTGLASLFKTFESTQQSSGTLTAQGLRPDQYRETKINSGNKEALTATFAWPEKSLALANGNTIPLPEQAQDIISFLYQLSQLPLGQGMLPIHISNGKKLERYELEVGAEEYIQTGFGRLRALPLRKRHAPGEEGLDIWLGVEYRLLPVKVRQIDRSGQIAGEMVISEIRVADE